MRRFWHNFITGFSLMFAVVVFLGSFGAPIVVAVVTECWWWGLLEFITVPLGIASLMTVADI